MITEGDIKDPEKLTKKLAGRPASQLEIRSHSSILTNKRVHDLFSWADYANIAAFRNTNIPSIHEYFVIINTLIDNTFMLIDKDGLSEVIKLRDKYWDHYHYFMGLKKGDKYQGKRLMDMLFATERMDQLIRAGLQKKQYFYKVGERDIRDIDTAIEIVRKGGGIFGGDTNRENGSAHTKVSDVDGGE